MHTDENPKNMDTGQDSAPRADAPDNAVPSSPPEAAGTAANTDAQEMAQLELQLNSLTAENEALRKENQALSQRAESRQAEAAGRTEDTIGRLNELKTTLTDEVYLLVRAYEDTVEKIDSLIGSLTLSVRRDKPDNEKAQVALDGAANAPQETRLPAGEVHAPKAADKITEEKKVSIIETLKNNSTPAEPVKPTFGVTHKERANAKNLLQKYAKIK